MKKNLKKGFTLTELIVVIVIIGILAAVLIPTLTSYINRARKSAAEQDAMTRLQEVTAFILDDQNENWFTWNEFVKGSNLCVKTESGYYVFFEKGELKQDKTSQTNPNDSSTTVTLLSYAGGVYSVVLLDADETAYFNGKLLDSTSPTRNKYAAEKTGFTVTVSSGAIAFTPAA